MNNKYKHVFGRTLLTLLILLIQIIAVIAFFTFLNEYFAWAYFGLLAISIIGIFTLFFKAMPVEGKLSWAIFILLLPPVGVILYILFSNNRISNRQKKIHDRIERRKIKENSEDLEKKYSPEVMKKIMPLKYYNQMEYIKFVNKQIGYLDTKTKYYPLGEDFFKDLIIDLKNAKDFIFMEYFIVEQGLFMDSIVEVLAEKVKEGVEVRLMYDDFGSIAKVSTSYCKYLRSLGINCIIFNRMIPIASAVHNNRDHRKITVIDGKIGYTGGVNLADEYINHTHPLKQWKDTAIRIEGEAVDSLTFLFLENFDLQKNKVEDSISRYINKYDVEKTDGVVVPYGDGPRPRYNEYVGENVYINLINSAEKYVWITTPYLIIDSKLLGAIQNAAAKGVDVRIITPHVPDKKIVFAITRSFYEPLKKYGVNIYEYTPGFIHAKQVLVDDECGVIGTINFDYRSLLHHYENGIWMYKTSALKEMKQDFKKIFDVSQSMRHYKQNKVVRFMCKLLSFIQPLL